jgi:apolipoprotein N-acyltransferase
MPQPSAASPNRPIPLVVDLDGTLIKTDLLWESIARLLRRNPFALCAIVLWWTRGRAFLKRKLAARVQVDPASLPFHQPFLKFLREQKATGRKLVLATASDLQMAKPVADYTGLFDEVLGSDGKTNLRSGNKAKVLAAKFGERGFDYAGNSAADLAVWRAAREAIVVNASRALARQAANCATPGPAFTGDYSPLFTTKRFLGELFIRSGYLAAIGAGLLLAAAFPKAEVAGFAWIAPALLVFAAQNKSGGEAFRVGSIAGFSFWLTSLYWLLLMPVAGLPILGWLALCAYLALYFAVWLWLISRFMFHVSGSWLQRTFGSLAGAAIWVALEMIRARLLGGFPWNFLGASQFKLIPLIQIASVTGVYGVSFLVVWASLSFYSAAWMIFRRPALRLVWQAEIFLPLTAVIVLFGLSFTQVSAQPPPASTWRVTLIQPSIPQTLIWDETANSNRFQQLLALSEKALDETHNPLARPSATLSPPSGERDGVRGMMKTDLLIWPESAVPEFDDATYAAITNLVRMRRVWLIFNADDVGPRLNATNGLAYDYFNAAFLFDPNGQFAGVYHKQKLVIFGEYIPLTRWLPFLKWFTPITGSYTAGDTNAQFEIGRWGERPREPQPESSNGSSRVAPRQVVTASPLICFEDTFPELARRAVRRDTGFLVNLTNDGWFGDSAEQWQHMANAIFRAVENGVPLVRCCNNGVTCWIDAHGRVREIFRDKTGSVYGAGAMTIDLPVGPHAPTFYNRHGDWFGWGCIGVALILLAFKLPRRR